MLYCHKFRALAWKYFFLHFFELSSVKMKLRSGLISECSLLQYFAIQGKGIDDNSNYSLCVLLHSLIRLEKE